MKRAACNRRGGQAAVECAIAIMIFAFVILALVEFGRVFLSGMEMMDHARRDAGEGALSMQRGESLGSKTEDFDMNLQFFGAPLFQDSLRLREEASLPASSLPASPLTR